MKALLWKDFYINRLVLGAIAFVFVLPFAIGIPHNFAVDSAYVYRPAWATLLLELGMYSLYLSLIGTAVLAGTALAGERADRSAEFMLSLPIGRRQILISKIVVAVASLLCVWMIDLVIIYVIAPRMGHVPSWQSQTALDMREDILEIGATTAVLVFGMAWFCSSILASPAIASVSGIAAPVILILALTGPGYFFAWNRVEHLDVESWYCRLALLLGILGFGVGSACYLRRVEP